MVFNTKIVVSMPYADEHLKTWLKFDGDDTTHFHIELVCPDGSEREFLVLQKLIHRNNDMVWESLQDLECKMRIFFPSSLRVRLAYPLVRPFSSPYLYNESSMGILSAPGFWDGMKEVARKNDLFLWRDVKSPVNSLERACFVKKGTSGSVHQDTATLYVAYSEFIKDYRRPNLPPLKVETYAYFYDATEPVSRPDLPRY